MRKLKLILASILLWAPIQNTSKPIGNGFEIGGGLDFA